MNRRQFFKLATASGLYLAIPKIAHPLIFGYSVGMGGAPPAGGSLGNSDVEPTSHSYSGKTTRFQAGSNFTAVKGYFYTGLVMRQFYIVVYDDNGGPGYPDNLLGCTGVLTASVTPGWVSGTLSPSVSISSGTYYHIGYVQSSTSSGQPIYYSDDTETSYVVYNRALSSGCPDPYSGTLATGRLISCYISSS